MRTTVDLTEDAYHVAKSHAAVRKISLGKAISELILSPSDASRGKNVVREEGAKWPSVHVDQVLTVERVKVLLDDE